MTTLGFRLRRFAVQHRDFPAFHVGLFVVTFIVAGLFNLGTLGMVLLCTLALDVAWLLGHSRTRGMQLLLLAIRCNLETIALLAAATVITATMFDSVRAVSAAPLSVIVTEVTIISSVCALAAKWKILTDFLYTLLTFGSRTHVPQFSQRWNVRELLCVTVIVFSVLSLLAAPTLSGRSQQTEFDILQRELIPHLR